MKIGRQIIIIIYLKALKNNQRRKLGNVPFQGKKRQSKLLNFPSFHCILLIPASYWRRLTCMYINSSLVLWEKLIALYVFCLFVSCLFGHTVQHVGSQFPNQGSVLPVLGVWSLKPLDHQGSPEKLLALNAYCRKEVF